MNRFVFGGVFFASICCIVAAQSVEFRAVAPRFPDMPSAKVYMATARLASDEVLVIREVCRRADGSVYLTDAVTDARGMDAEYRIVCTPALGGGTQLDFLSTKATRKERTTRTSLREACLEMEFRNPGDPTATIYGWFARVEKIADLKRRHPGYTPIKKPWLISVSSGSRFLVASNSRR